MEAMERLMQGRTSFMIAHRLSTLDICDILLLIDNGRLANVTVDVSKAVKHTLNFNRLESVIQVD